MAGEQADGARTRALLEESVALYRGLGDDRAAAVAQNALAVACQLMGDLAAARAHLEAVLHDARRLDDADTLARGLNNLASVAHACGNTAEAVRLYGECRELFEERGDRLAVAWALDQEGDAARDGGDPVCGAGALRAQPRDLPRARQPGRRGHDAHRPRPAWRGGRATSDTARRRCQEALALGELGSDRAAARLLEEVAALAAGDGQPYRALVLLRGGGRASGAAGLAGARLGEAAERAADRGAEERARRPGVARVERRVADERRGSAAPGPGPA